MEQRRGGEWIDSEELELVNKDPSGKAGNSGGGVTFFKTHVCRFEDIPVSQLSGNKSTVISVKKLVYDVGILWKDDIDENILCSQKTACLEIWSILEMGSQRQWPLRSMPYLKNNIRKHEALILYIYRIGEE